MGHRSHKVERVEERSDHNTREHHRNSVAEAGSLRKLDLVRLKGVADRIGIGVFAHMADVLHLDLVGAMAVHIHTAVVVVD